MVYYGSSTYYPVIGSNHAKIIRYAARCVRQPIALVASEHVFDFSEDGPLSDATFPADTEVELLDNDARVVALSFRERNATFSSDYNDIAVACALNGWLVVKVPPGR